MKITKSPGQRYFESTNPNGVWESLDDAEKTYHANKALDLGIESKVIEIPDPLRPKTDGELWKQADDEHALPESKAWKFLKLLRERDANA